MSANSRTFDDVIRNATLLLRNHDAAEYEALKPSAKANYQESLEFLRRLESEIETDGGASIDVKSDTETNPETEADTDLESTMGDDGSVVGPFDGHDVVVYDPEGGSESWISMTYDATISFEDSC